MLRLLKLFEGKVIFLVVELTEAALDSSIYNGRIAFNHQVKANYNGEERI
jgi:hypothetical protein